MTFLVACETCGTKAAGLGGLMVRRSGPSESGKVKLRVVEFELEGNDATLQESLRSISAAINRATAGMVPTSVKRANALMAAAKKGSGNGNEQLRTDAVEDADGSNGQNVDPM